MHFVITWSTSIIWITLGVAAKRKKPNIMWITWDLHTPSDTQWWRRNSNTSTRIFICGSKYNICNPVWAQSFFQYSTNMAAFFYSPPAAHKTPHPSRFVCPLRPTTTKRAKHRLLTLHICAHAPHIRART